LAAHTEKIGSARRELEIPVAELAAGGPPRWPGTLLL